MSTEIISASQSNSIILSPQLRKVLETTTEETKTIVRLRFEGAMFRDMNEEKLFTSAQEILTTLALITGIKIPTGESFNKLAGLVAESLYKDYSFYSVPLMKQGLKKHATILIAGENKSYGRTLSLADIHQVMNEFTLEVHHANKEVDDLLNQQSQEKFLQETDKQNIIRKSIQQTYESGNFNCTFVDFNQLVRDGLLKEDAVKKTAWQAIQTLKEKYRKISESIATTTDRYNNKGDRVSDENINGVLQKKNLSEKIMLLNELEEEIKAQTASLFMQWSKDNNVKALYKPESK
jgi:hypothetical protein